MVSVRFFVLRTMNTHSFLKTMEESFKTSKPLAVLEEELVQGMAGTLGEDQELVRPEKAGSTSSTKGNIFLLFTCFYCISTAVANRKMPDRNLLCAPSSIPWYRF